MKRKHLTIYIESKDDCGGTSYTLVKTYKEEIAAIYFLEDENCTDFYYYITYNIDVYSPCFLEEKFKTEIDAIRFICRKEGLTEKYENLKLRLGTYWNSEVGAITYEDNIETLNLAA